MAATVSARRAAALVAVGAAVALSACGSSNTAAVVDGRVISESDAQQAAAQINDTFHPQNGFTTRDAVGSLITAPLLIEAAAKSGHPQSASAARAQMPTLHNPSDATIELVQADTALQFLTQQDKVNVVSQLKKQHITVNPRYGTFDASQGSISAQTPNWIKNTEQG